MSFLEFDEKDLPPEPGEVPHEDHGIPGPAEDYPSDDREVAARELEEGDEEEDED